jgi:8-oxo-dGTP pyrophosphatase MutT (NUDIX family)
MDSVRNLKKGFREHIDSLRIALRDVPHAPREALANRSNAAAVLVPIFDRAGEPHIVYIRRSDDVASHRGQVAFPGGRVDPIDVTILDAALREAEEEVALPRHHVEVIGAMPVVMAQASGIVVAPFAGVMNSSAELRADPREVAEIFDVPLSALRDPKHRGDYEWRRDNGAVSKFPAILYGGQTIWGLTLRITLTMLDAIAGRAPV